MTYLPEADHMLGQFYTFLCSSTLRSGVREATPIIIGGAWGLPGTSLTIAESICDVSARVGDLSELICASGRQRGGPGRPKGRSKIWS